jgi:hypothetical protein
MVSTRKSTKRKANQDSNSPKTRQSKKTRVESNSEIEQDMTNEACSSKEVDNDMRSNEDDHQHFQTRFLDRSKKGKEKACDLVPMEDVPTMDMSNEASLPESTVTSDIEDDESDEDSIDWENVQLPPRFDIVDKWPQEDEAVDQNNVYKDVEIVMENSIARPVLK